MRKGFIHPFLATACLAQPFATTPAGPWSGSIQLPGQTLAIQVTFVPGPPLQGRISIPAQGLKDFEMKVVQEGSSLTLAMEGIPGEPTFRGLLKEGALAGMLTQGGQSFPFTLEAGAPKASAKPAVVRRPQEPQAPFPYEVAQVRFPGGGPGVTLSGTLSIPKGAGPFPAVILVAGSGPNDRDEKVFGHRPFLVLADHLARHGIASLRYDKRGIGESTGSFAAATTFDFAADAEQALAFLKTRPEVDGKAMGLVGHSEGGLVGPIVASRTPLASFLVLLGGPGVTGEEILYAQAELLAKAEGAPATALQAQRAQQEKLFTCLKQHPEGAREPLRALLTEGLSPERLKAAEAGVNAQIGQLDSPWFRTFLTLDPGPYLRKVKVPVLALFGEKDLQVPPAQSRVPMERALRDAGNGRAEVRVLTGLNHLFQPAVTGGTSEYAASEITMDPGALKAISAWILAPSKRP